MKETVVPMESDNCGLTVKEVWQYYPFFTDIFWKHRILNQDTTSYSSLLKFKSQMVVKIDWNWHLWTSQISFIIKITWSFFIIIFLLSILSFLPYWVIDLPNYFTLYHLKYVLLPIMSTFGDIIQKCIQVV